MSFALPALALSLEAGDSFRIPIRSSSRTTLVQANPADIGCNAKATDIGARWRLQQMARSSWRWSSVIGNGAVAYTYPRTAGSPGANAEPSGSGPVARCPQTAARLRPPRRSEGSIFPQTLGS